MVFFAMTAFIGVYAVSVAISDGNTAGQAVRSAARYGAQVGGNNYRTTALDPCQGGTRTNPCHVDAAMLGNVLEGLTDMRFATVKQVVFYEPCAGGCGTACVAGSANSPYNSGTDRGEVYVYGGSGPMTSAASYSMVAGRQPASGAYTLDLRNQTHPREAAIGVEVDYTYQSPTPLVRVTLSSLKEFTVNCFAPTG